VGIAVQPITISWFYHVISYKSGNLAILEQKQQEYFMLANIEFPEDRVPRRLDRRRRSAAGGRERCRADGYGSDRASCDSVGQHRSAPSRLSVVTLFSLLFTFYSKMVYMVEKT
jgi:hypothetical protein